MIEPPRTYLFVPGNRPERYAKALASGADAVVIDLEDAVAPAAKSAARDAVAAWSSSAAAADRQRVAVRINGAETAAFADDLRLLRSTGLACVMLAKAEAAEQVAAVVAASPRAMVLALIESALGLDRLDRIVASAHLARLVFGTLDYALDLGIDAELDTEFNESAPALAAAASRIAVASRVAGLASPVAGITAQFDDDARLGTDWAAARAQGFGAKLCIHPRQIAPLHRAMQPSAAAIERARRVLAAEAASPGAAQLDGRLVDRPVVLQAERVLRLASLPRP